MKNSKIKSVKARQILDSRGLPTIEVELATESGSFCASVPSGTSTGKNEAKELPAKTAVQNVEKILSPKLKNKEVIKQKEIDDLMISLDGTEDKSKLGANAILGMSLAVCRAGAAAKGLPLYKYISSEIQSQKVFPKPCLLMIEGGVHAGNDLDFQEFMIMPQEKSFCDNLEIGRKIYQTLKKILEKKWGKSSINVGMEGGFTPNLKFSEQALSLITEAIERAGYKNKVDIVLDCAASQFYKKDSYQTNMGMFTKEGFIKYYSDLISKYPILGLEDPFSEDDWQSWKKFNSKALLIGDDLLTTNIKRVKKAVAEKACGGMIIKPNQIGTVSETLEVIKYAQENDFKIFVKHRSGETNDSFIADLALGVGADGIMSGAPARGERLAKYNRLLKIEEELYE